MESSSDEFKRMFRMVNMFLTRNDCEPFRQAVQWQALGLFDYPKIIKRVSIYPTPFCGALESLIHGL
jgi:hypothetical protein